MSEAPPLSEARSVYDTCVELKSNPVSLVGDSILRVQGPSGVWKVRMAFEMKGSGRGYWNMTIFSPTGKAVYSVRGLKKLLIAQYDIPPTLFDDDVVM